MQEKKTCSTNSEAAVCLSVGPSVPTRKPDYPISDEKWNGMNKKTHSFNLGMIDTFKLTDSCIPPSRPAFAFIVDNQNGAACKLQSPAFKQTKKSYNRKFAPTTNKRYPLQAGVKLQFPDLFDLLLSLGRCGVVACLLDRLHSPSLPL